MRLDSLSPAKGSKHRKKRVGCGESSGHGKTSGRGHKGQKARSGGSVRPGFEGGQMPLYRRLPKRGFSNEAFRLKTATFNLDSLAAFGNGAVVNEQSLRELNLLNGTCDRIKILGRGEINKKLVFEVDAVSDSARVKIEKAGGTIREKAASAGVAPDETTAS
ncbi:MAG: 50S ribosomal protein L15 [Verrucomicrobiia bacterium]